MVQGITLSISHHNQLGVRKYKKTLYMALIWPLISSIMNEE